MARKAKRRFPPFKDMSFNTLAEPCHCKKLEIWYPQELEEEELVRREELINKILEEKWVFLKRMVAIITHRAFRTQGKRNLRMIRWVKEELEKERMERERKAAQKEAARLRQIEEDARLARIEEERLAGAAEEEEAEKMRQVEEDELVTKHVELEVERAQAQRAKEKVVQIEGTDTSHQEMSEAVDELMEELERAEEGEDERDAEESEEEVPEMRGLMRMQRRMIAM